MELMDTMIRRRVNFMCL